MKYILIFILVLYGCSSTTTKTESEVDRAQFILLPEFLAMSMAEDGYKQELKKARENKQLNQNDEHVRRVREIGFNIIDQVIFLRDGTEDWNWEINVQESEEVNAYCMPGGKIMMYSALIEKTNVYIIYPNGTSIPITSWSSPRVKEGSTIIVNQRTIGGKQQISGWEAFSIVSSQAGNIATTLLSLSLIINQSKNGN